MNGKDMTDWVPECGDRVKLNAAARGSTFGSDGRSDGRRRWTVAAIRYHAGWRQPDIVMTDGDIWNVAWLEPASPKETS